jgi:hypothetical protein
MEGTVGSPDLHRDRVAVAVAVASTPLLLLTILEAVAGLEPMAPPDTLPTPGTTDRPEPQLTSLALRAYCSQGAEVIGAVAGAPI